MSAAQSSLGAPVDPDVRPAESVEQPVVDGPRGRAIARRAFLPWRQRVRGLARFNYTPKRFKDLILSDLPILYIFFFPFWLPAAIVGLIAGLELLLALPFLPIALLYRRLRHAWPVQAFDAQGRESARTHHRTWREAGKYAHELRSRHGHVLRMGETG